MPEIMRHADLETTEGIIRRINEYLDDVEHLYKSVKEFLDDPDVPGKMDFTPHASEVYMTYESIDPQWDTIPKEGTHPGHPGQT